MAIQMAPRPAWLRPTAKTAAGWLARRGVSPQGSRHGLVLGPRVAPGGKRGQSLVEFALVLPIFLLLLFAVLDFGFALYSQVTVINAAREGARVATTDPDRTTIAAVVQSRVQTTATFLNLGYLAVPAPACVAIASLPGTCDFNATANSKSGDAVKVTVNYTYHTFFPLFFGATFNLSATTQMILQ